ncbi:MAG: aromatic amino acid transport family protein [Chlamydiales bacterium]
MKLSKTFGGILLVAGTAIGAGMLALPVITGQGGLLPAFVVFIICWLFSASTGLLFLEICLDMPQNANLVTMASQLLGRAGKYAAWILYLFLFYCLTIAYTAGGGDFIYQVFGGALPKPLTTLLFVTLFGSFVYIGTKAVDRVNYILMGGLILTYILFITFGFSQVEAKNLTTINWKYGFLALPVMFTSFSYQGIIPTLNTYLDRDPRRMRKAILIGSAIPLIAYLIWEFLILGIVPATGLMAAKAAGTNAITPLRLLLNNPTVYLIGEFFGFFALTTSFLGVTLGLLDFLSDSLEVKKTPLSKLLLCSLIYIPPLIVVLINPNIFLTALGYAGGIGCALLLGLMPILMTWVARYKRGYTHLNRQLPGGKPVLILLAAFVFFELMISLF